MRHSGVAAMVQEYAQLAERAPYDAIEVIASSIDKPSIDAALAVPVGQVRLVTLRCFVARKSWAIWTTMAIITHLAEPESLAKAPY